MKGIIIHDKNLYQCAMTSKDMWKELIIINLILIAKKICLILGIGLGKGFENLTPMQGKVLDFRDICLPLRSRAVWAKSELWAKQVARGIFFSIFWAKLNDFDILFSGRQLCSVFWQAEQISYVRLSYNLIL